VNADIHTLTGAYAMDALSDTERVAFEQHMGECASCAAEVAELQDTAARLGTAVAVKPPAALKRQVLAAAGRTRQLPPPPPSVAFAASPTVKPRWQLWAAGIAAAACFVAAVVLGVQLASVNRQLDAGNRQVAQAQQQLDAVMSVLSAPDAKIASATVGDSTGTAIVSHSRGKVAFMARGMPQLPGDRSYQLWLIGPSGMQSVGVLAAGVDPAPVIGDLSTAHTGIGVTIEPRGGSAQPTGDPVMIMGLPA
jgi:anti-sigma-K factor RskA